MEGRCNRQPLGGNALSGQVGFDALDGLGRPGQDDLAVAVVIRDDDVGVRLFEDRPNRLNRAGDRSHRPRCLCCLGHEDAAPLSDAHHVDVGEDATRVKRGDFPKTVPSDVLRIEPDQVEHPQQAEAHCANGRLRPVCCGEEGLVDARCAVFERGDRKDDLVERLFVPSLVGSEVPRSHRLSKIHGQVGAHADVLTSLAREKECDIATLATHAVVHASRCRKRGAGRFCDAVDCLGELACQIVFVGGNHGQPGGLRRVVRALRCLCKEGQLPVEEVTQHLCCLRGDVGRVSTTEHHHLDVATA